EVHPHRDVDDELLPVAALVLKHPVMAAYPEPAQLDPVVHDGPSPEVRARDAPRCHAVATATASIDDATSCTRTPHAPRSAASPVMTAEARSRPAGGLSAPSASASRCPRNRFRDAPTSTGNP